MLCVSCRGHSLHLCTIQVERSVRQNRRGQPPRPRRSSPGSSRDVMACQSGLRDGRSERVDGGHRLGRTRADPRRSGVHPGARPLRVRFRAARLPGFQLFDFQEPLLLQFREALTNPAKEDPFGIVVHLKLPNEPSLSIVKLFDGVAERTHLPLTLPLRFPVEGPEVMFEQISPWGRIRAHRRSFLPTLIDPV
jgi:hypothetical protein